MVPNITICVVYEQVGQGNTPIYKHIKLLSHYSNQTINLIYQALYLKDSHMLNDHRRHAC